MIPNHPSYICLKIVVWKETKHWPIVHLYLILLVAAQMCLSVSAKKVSISVCCSTQTKYWITVLETYWSTITSMAFWKILVQYQHSIEILNYFPVSLSVFQKKDRGQNLRIYFFLKIYHIRKFIVSCQLSNFWPEMPNCLNYWTKCYLCPRQIGSLCFGVLCIPFQNKDLTHASLLWWY